MRLFSTLASFWRNLRWRPRLERDLDEEVQGYAELLAAEKVAKGMTPEEARRAARLELGGVEQVKEQVRDAWFGLFLDTLWQDVRYAARTLAKSPGFTLAAVLALALGIGANTAVFSAVYGVLLRPLPYPDADRLALVHMRFSPQNNDRGTLSIADYLDWKAANRAFEDPVLYTVRRIDILRGGDTGAEPEQVSGAMVTAGFFTALRSKPLLGRTFLPGDDSPTGEPVAVLSEDLWRRRFGANPAVIGQKIRTKAQYCTIVGVMPASLHFPRQDTELWTSLPLEPPKRRGPFFYRGFGRLNPGVSLEQAQQEANAVGRNIEQAHPQTYSRLTLPVVPLHEATVGSVRLPLLVMFWAVLLVLLISMVNVASLLLARANTREREMAVRASLGAGRGRLLRQLLTESVLLALPGGAAGLLLAEGAIRALRYWNPGNLPRIEEIHLDGRVLAFTFLVSLLSGILFGLVPALQASRAAPGESLKEGGRSGTPGASRHRIHAALVVSEIALSLMLLIGAGLFVRSFVRLQQVSPGFQAPPENLLTMRISPAGVNYDDAVKLTAFYERLLERVRQMPGVESAAVSDSLPPDREADADTFVIAGQQWSQEANPSVSAPLVSVDYFRALGIPLLRGRYFTAEDTANSPPVVIISEAMARRYFAGRDPIGERLKRSGPGPELSSPFMEIVGVVGDVKYMGLQRESGLAYYEPTAQNREPRMFLAIRSAAASGLASAVLREIQALDRQAVVVQVTTMDQSIYASVAAPRFRTMLLGFFAGIALLLAAIGIYGVVAYSVTQRTHEIGIRMAVGARRLDVLRLVLGQGATLALLGICIGLGGSLALTQMLAQLLFSVKPTDPLTFGGVSLALAAVALLASFIPARRATRIDPLVALRYE